jgi:endonuclease/exonuclease/phosphatase family metal-dependent hydrolase
MPHGDESYANSIYDDMGHFAEQQRQSELEKLRAENAALHIQVERMTAERDDALVLVGKFNSGAELQTVMRLNNQLVAKVEVLTMKLAKAKTAVSSDKSGGDHGHR